MDKPEIGLDVLITPYQAAKARGIVPQRLYNAIRQNRIPWQWFTTDTGKEQERVTLRAVDEYLTARKEEAATEYKPGQGGDVRAKKKAQDELIYDLMAELKKLRGAVDWGDIEVGDTFNEYNGYKAGEAFEFNHESLLIRFFERKTEDEVSMRAITPEGDVRDMDPSIVLPPKVG